VAGPVAHPQGGRNHQASAVVGVGYTLQSSSWTVNTQKFTVNIATSGTCWVQVTSSDSPTPLVSGVQQAGKLLSFPAKGTMTVQVGSAAVAVAIYINGHGVFLNSPHQTPYTYTFAPQSSS
jgi:hypothetical protein